MMPWRWGWPPYVSQYVLNDRARANADLDQASDELRETIARAHRIHRVADSLARARDRNHFSESMELLFAAPRPHGPHRTKETP